MKKEQFENGMRKIFAIFGKKEPDYDTKESIWQRIGELPDAFMDYAIEQIQDEDKLPVNLGKYLMRDLWPEFISKHPELKAARYYDCAECGGSGSICAYRQDDSLYSGLAFYFGCVCRKGDKGWTRDRIAALGNYTFEMHNSPKGNITLQDIKNKYTSAIGHNEAIRPAHREFLEEQGDF